MKLLTFKHGTEERLGAVSEDGSRVFPLDEMGICYRTMNELVENLTDAEQKQIEEKLAEEKSAEKKLAEQKQAREQQIKEQQSEEMARQQEKQGWIAYETITACAPIPRPRQDVICLGINYMAHAEESSRYKKEAFGGERPFPVYFSKRVNEAVGDRGIIPAHQDMVECLDYETELAVVLGKEAKNVSKEDALDYVFGYTVLNDMSARTVQIRHKQWYFGKSLDGFTPMGPWIVTKDEFDGAPKLPIRSYVNGELRQNSTTDLLIFDIPYVISELSQGMTLLPGTIISMGTPAGVGMGFDPPKFLKPGDEVICEVEGIGRITNVIG